MTSPQYSSIADIETPDIRPVSPSTVFYHGTRAPEFEHINPGTCFTTDVQTAIWFSQRGAFPDHAKTPGTSRVLAAHINLPHHAVFIPTSSIFSELISMVQTSRVSCPQEEIDRDHQEQKLRAAYHNAATAFALHLGFDAYFADMYSNDEAALVILNPDDVTIIDHDILASLTPAQAG